MSTPTSKWRVPRLLRVLCVEGVWAGQPRAVPRAFPLENGRSGRHPIHFLTEKPWGRGCREEERSAI